MRLTEQQAAEAVAQLRAPQGSRDALLAQWRAGAPGARFAVFNLWRRLPG